jgi:hypothetical protein
MKSLIGCVLCGLAVVGVAAAAVAQGMPAVRDSRTGRTWTPDLSGPGGAQDVDQMGQPTSPDAYVNRAFDPRTQSAHVSGVVVQRPRANLMGTVPITAGPSVPIVTIDLPTLQALPGRYWLSILYLTNNSGATVDAVVGCHFLNRDSEVENVRVIIPPAGPGERLGVPVRGPRTELYVDRVNCNVISPV